MEKAELDSLSYSVGIEPEEEKSINWVQIGITTGIMIGLMFAFF